MYRWTGEMIRFLEDAAPKTEYYAGLAARLEQMLPGCESICDVGCGLGHLSEFLCRSFTAVTAVDCSAEALDAFRRRLVRQPENLQILCLDAFSMPKNLRFDAMIFCYFGSLPDILRIARRHCTGKVIIVRQDYEMHRFDLGGHPRLRAGAKQTVESLTRQGIVFTCESFSAEFGQPLRSLDDAVRFFRLYQRDSSQEIRPETVQDRLISTGDPVFPYYVRQKKDVQILCFDAAQIPR